MKIGYMGKGERVQYDARLGVAVEYLNGVLGYYPSLRQISEFLNDGSTTAKVFNSLRRMIKHGELSAAATKNYGVRKENGKADYKGNKKSNVKEGIKKV